MHSWQSHGVALTTCELGNAPLFGAFPDRGGVSLAPPRRWLAEGKTEGLSILPVNLLGSSRGVSRRILAKSPVGSLPPANLETAHCARRFRAPAQMRSRCVGRGAASIGAKPRGTQRLAKFAPLRRERGLYRARRWRVVQHLCWRRDGESKLYWFSPVASLRESSPTKPNTL